MSKKDNQKSKPVAPIQSLLRLAWFAWLSVTLFVYPLVVSISTEAVFWAGVGVQFLGLLPAFVFTPVVYRGWSAYGLIVTSLLALIYWGFVGVQLFLYLYEQAPRGISLILSLNFILLLWIIVLLFILLKRLPAMHKQGQ